MGTFGEDLYVKHLISMQLKKNLESKGVLKFLLVVSCQINYE